MICYTPGFICYGSENFGLGSLQDDYVGLVGATPQFYSVAPYMFEYRIANFKWTSVTILHTRIIFCVKKKPRDWKWNMFGQCHRIFSDPFFFTHKYLFYLASYLCTVWPYVYIHKCSENNRNTGASLLRQNNYVIHIPHAKSFPPSYSHV